MDCITYRVLDEEQGCNFSWMMFSCLYILMSCGKQNNDMMYETIMTFFSQYAGAGQPVHDHLKRLIVSYIWHYYYNDGYIVIITIIIMKWGRY